MIFSTYAIFFLLPVFVSHFLTSQRKKLVPSLERKITAESDKSYEVEHGCIGGSDNRVCGFGYF